MKPSYLPQLRISEITELIPRDNFKQLDDYFKEQNQLLNFNFFEVNFTKAEVEKSIAHGLGSIPLDVMTTHLSGAGAVSFLFGLFDKTNIYLTATDACKVRFFVGTHFKTPGTGGLLTSAKQTVT